MKTFLDGRTPAHYAAIFNRYDAINLLIEHGANLETKNMEHFTVFEEAIKQDHQPMLEAIWLHAKKYKRDMNDVS